MPLQSHADAAAAAPQLKFDIKEFRVLGNRVLPQTSVERAVYPFLGPGGDLDGVKKAADALQGAYKDAGFGTVLVDIPEQQVDDGIVRLRVIEGTLDKIRVRGERYFSGRQILAALPALQPKQAPNLPALQDQLTALNARTGDRVVTPILKAGAQPGSVDIDLNVQDTSPFHASVEVDNHHTADTTPTRASVSMSYSNLWQRQDVFSLLYQTAPANVRNAQVVSASYLGHAGGNDGEFLLSFVHTSSNVNALDTLGVLGKGSIVGTHWVQPLVNSPSTSQSFNLGFDYKDVSTEVFSSTTAAGGNGVRAPIKYLNWSATYSGVWRQPRGSVATNIGIGFGIKGLVNTQAEFENARYLGDPNYIYLRLSGEGTHTLPAGFAVLARWSGQWTESPLVNNEQFALGGSDTVRGYLEAETLGDAGLVGNVEFHSPIVGERLGKTLRMLYAFVFVDGGVATLLDPLPQQAHRSRLWSTGFGLRLENAAGFSGNLDYAIPQVTDTRTHTGDARIDFSVKYDF